MESHSHDDQSSPVDPLAALRVSQQAQGRLASRVRSPWWFHLLRGLSVAAMVVGLAGAPETGPYLLLGVVALAALARWRTRTVGVTRANTERWRFVALGAPWSVLALVATVAGMASVVVLRDEPAWQVAVIAGIAGALVAALGPAADSAARRRLAAPQA